MSLAASVAIDEVDSCCGVGNVVDVPEDAALLSLSDSLPVEEP